MPEPEKNQRPFRLLALYDALNQPETAVAADPDVSDELFSALHEFATSVMLFDESWSQADDDRLSELLLQEPQGFALLQRLLNQVEKVEELGPVPEEILQQQFEKLFSRGASQTPSAKRRVDFSIILSKGGLRYSGNVPRRIVRSYDMARDESEQTLLLQHLQRLSHCEVKVSIETGRQQSFTILIEITFVEPQYRGSQLTISLVNSAGNVELSKVVESACVEFEGIASGTYIARVTADDKSLGEFCTELQLNRDE